MRWVPFILFFLYVYLEISFFVVVANSIGVLLALICIVATSIIGLSLVKSQGIKNLVQMQQKMAQNENPTTELVTSVSLLISGFLLLIPGFLTDILGAILLLPPVRNVVTRYLVPKMQFTARTTSTHQQREDVIEGEFTRKDE